jgi:hypothetical protein
MINYNNKYFRPVSNSQNGETSNDTIFHYLQEDNIVMAEYAGGKIVKGQLIGIADPEGKLNFRYQQVNQSGEFMTGKGISVPEQMPDGKIRLHEQWQWTSGDLSHGNSIIEEV